MNWSQIFALDCRAWPYWCKCRPWNLEHTAASHLSLLSGVPEFVSVSYEYIRSILDIDGQGGKTHADYTLFGKFNLKNQQDTTRTSNILEGNLWQEGHVNSTNSSGSKFSWLFYWDKSAHRKVFLISLGIRSSLLESFLVFEELYTYWA